MLPMLPPRSTASYIPSRRKLYSSNQGCGLCRDAAPLLAWYKLLDDAKDENRLYAKATMVMLRGIYRKLRVQYPDLCKGLEDNLESLATLEAAHCKEDDLRRPTPLFP